MPNGVDRRFLAVRTLGKVWLEKNHWHVECEPHVAMWTKRVFPKIKKEALGVLKIRNTDAVCNDLRWLLQRFELENLNPEELSEGATRNVDKILRLNDIVGDGYQPREISLALPPRKYQSQAADLYLAQSFLLLADDVGLGKTVSSIASLVDKRTLPAAVVTLAGTLPRQWQTEINRFAPQLFTHIIKKGSYYKLPVKDGRKPDVLILNYHKLPGWAEVLSDYCESIVYDEVQELRHTGTLKYFAAEQLAEKLKFRLGLSATPIYNYGGELFNVLSILQPDVLGTRDEFATEWMSGDRLKDPAAFGSYLREQHIMLRRTRKEVGRELPALQKIIQEVESDETVFSGINDAASELARIILSRTSLERGDVMRASAEFDVLMRQATGVAKAPFVAAVVKLLIESGERVLLYGWHRAVYNIWLDRLQEFKPALFTGSESPAEKQVQRDRFVNGETPLMIMSLRSGAGVDGLQHNCRTVVLGEFDWSPGVHEQCIGRIYRDGQPDPVTVYFLMSDSGSDPLMATTLGIKRDQIDGIREMKSGDLERLDTGGANVRQLAEQYLAKRGIKLQEVN